MPRRRSGYYSEDDSHKEDRDLSIRGRRMSAGQSSKKHTQNSRVKLSIAHVYGYRGHDTRSNVLITPKGFVVYHVAAVGISLNPDTGDQKIYVGHDDDILCLALHPELEIVATGQVGKHATVHIWGVSTMKSINILTKGQSNGVGSVDFSEDGKRLLTVGIDTSSTIIIWDWKKGTQLASAKGHSDRVFGAKFEPRDASRFVTYGIKHIKFWTHVPGGSTLSSNRGICGNVGPAETHLTAEYGDEERVCYSGAANGMVYAWHSNNLAKVIQCHSGPIITMFPLDKGFLTAGKDGFVRQWNSHFSKQQHEFEIQRAGLTPDSPSTLIHDHPCIRAVALGSGVIVAGTKNGEIVEINKEGKLRILTQGHSEGEVWGLSVHPSEPECVTVSDDKYLRVWATTAPFAPLAVRKLGKPARSVDYSHDGSLIAVGFGDGSVQVLSEEDFSIKFKFHHRKEEISDVKFQPKETRSDAPSILAVASHDNFVDFYDLRRGDRIGAGGGASSFITHIDWTVDGTMLQCNSGAKEHLYYDAKGKRLPVDPVDLEAEGPWYTWTSVLGPTVEGIRPKESDSTDVNACCLDPSQEILATADDFGLVKLFDYPAIGRHATPLVEGRGHSSHVTNIRWMQDCSAIVSVGGADTSLIVWHCEK